MTKSSPAVALRPAEASDRAAIADLLDEAFGSALESRFVAEVQRGELARCELVAAQHRSVVGHILFTPLSVDDSGRAIESLALAPLAVHPACQRVGIGHALVEAGLNCARSAGVGLVVVLGDPDYYTRFGFSAELGARLRAPWSGPAFMAIELEHGVLEGDEIEVTYPPVFRIFDP